jgi:excisionase family DNA binding protein
MIDFLILVHRTKAAYGSRMATREATPPPLTVAGAAAYMNCSRWTVYRLVREGALRPLKVGTRLRFRAAELDRYMERSP